MCIQHELNFIQDLLFKFKYWGTYAYFLLTKNKYIINELHTWKPIRTFEYSFVINFVSLFQRFDKIPDIMTERVCAGACALVHACVCVCLPLHAGICASVRAGAHVYMSFFHVCVSFCASACVCAQLRACVCVCECACVRARAVGVYECARPCVCERKNACTYAFFSWVWINGRF